nr:MBOAT family O-acyltransferase [uncultured Carboxylicivirga sp.]
MDIISIEFTLIVLGAVFIYYLLNHKYRSTLLVMLSGGFVASYSYFLLLYVLVYGLVNYIIGIKLENAKSRKWIFRTGLLINIGQLVILKYASFAIDPFIELLDFNFTFTTLSNLIIPIGISYFTLQSIGYLINIKMGWEKADKNFIDFLLYLIFFPKFLSGPIERSNHFLPQLKKTVVFKEENIIEGLRLALIGAFKKVVIANQLAPLITVAYSDISSANATLLGTVILLQPLYLYFDFSGYTDIALGIARMFGINLLPNFSRPFFAENVSLFWRKFHMSLSLWFSDYIFKQTMFRRRKWGNLAPIYALVLTWTLFGIWHGAGWNFMILGVIQAIAIIYEFFTKGWRKRFFTKWPGSLRIWTGRSLTYLFYAFSLVFFFSPDLGKAFSFLSGLGGHWDALILPINQKVVLLFTLLLVIIFMTGELLANDYPAMFSRYSVGWQKKGTLYRSLRWGLYFWLMAVIIVFKNDVQSFIYFQF